MGYTTYSIEVASIDGSELISAEQQDLVQRLVTSEFAEDRYCAHLITEYDNTKWRRWAEEMAGVSRRFPEYLFTLTGEGDHPGDIWTAYIVGGRIQHEQAEFSIAPFDPAKLVEVELTGVPDE